MTTYLQRLALVKPLYDNFGEEIFKRPVLGFFGKRDEQKLSIIREIFGVDIKDAKINIIAYGEDEVISYGLVDIYKLNIEDLGKITIYESEDEEFLEYCNRAIVYIPPKEKNLIIKIWEYLEGGKNLINKIKEYADKSSLVIIGEVLDRRVINKIEKEILSDYPKLKIKFFSIKRKNIDDMLYKAWLYEVREELLNKEITHRTNGFMEYVYPKINMNEKYKSNYTFKILGKHDDAIVSLLFSPDGKYLASGSKDKTIKIWSIGDQEEAITLRGQTYYSGSLSFSPKGKYLAIKDDKDNIVKIFSTNNWKKITILDGHISNITAVSFSPDGKYLASADSNGNIIIWSVSDWKQIITLKETSSAIYSISFSPDGRYLASLAEDILIVWSVKNWEKATTYNLDKHYLISFSPDGRYLASVGRNIIIWSVDNWTPINFVEEDDDSFFSFIKATFKTILTALFSFDSDKDKYSISFSPDGKYLAIAGNDETIRIRALNKEEVINFKGHTDKVRVVCFSPHGKYLASAGDDRTVKIWFVDPSYFEKNLQKILKDLKDIAFLSSLQKIVGEDIQNRSSIVFFGEFSSGKTTIINNLFELNLPVDVLPSTAVPTIITYGQSKKAYLMDTLFNIEEVKEEKLSEISHQNKEYARKYFYKIILLDKPILKNYIIIDTPGFSADSFDYKIATDILKLADKLVYVIDANMGSITREGLEILKSQKNLDCVVILNKIDNKKEDFEKIAKYNNEILRNNGINAEIKFFSSFLDERMIKNWKLSIMSELLKKNENSKFAQYFKKIYIDYEEFFS